MSFKHHLLIVCLIIIAVYLGWQTMNANAPAPQAPADTAANQYVIAISHASWGLNCNRVVINNANQNDPFANAATNGNQIPKDNILAGVSALCNGKVQCSIINTPENMGQNPVPECTSKAIDIEFRCFSYDRPRFISSPNKDVMVSCADAVPASAATPVTPAAATPAAPAKP